MDTLQRVVKAPSMDTDVRTGPQLILSSRILEQKVLTFTGSTLRVGKSLQDSEVPTFSGIFDVKVDLESE